MSRKMRSPVVYERRSAARKSGAGASFSIFGIGCDRELGHVLRMFEILYSDDAFVAVNKPSGLLTVPGRGADKQDCLCRRVLEKFPGALMVHRLDMDTSGLMVLALDARTQRDLSRPRVLSSEVKRIPAEMLSWSLTA